MVGDGNAPLKQPHYDEITLEEYILGQLLPDEEEAIRQHLVICTPCRVQVQQLQAVYQQIALGLRRELDRTTPGPDLSFEPIAREWRRPPRRTTWAFRLQRLVPDVSTTFLIGLFVIALVLVIPSGDAVSVRSLELARDYQGPPAMVAAATDGGLVILRLAPAGPQIAAHLDYLTAPRNLQFSPDGRWLALQQGRTLHLIETRTLGARVRVTVQDGADWSWSPDSQALAYTDGSGQLAVFEVPTQTNRVIVPAEESAWGAPIWSADSRQIAYAAVIPLPQAGSPPLRQSLWRVTPSNGFRVELARNPDPGTVLLTPAAWVGGNTMLLAWDAQAGAAGSPPALYRVDSVAHTITRIDGTSLAQGTRLAWPVSAQGVTLVVRNNQLIQLNLSQRTRQTMPDQMPWPYTLEWAPNGAWMAYTIQGAAEGRGLYLFAPQEVELRPIALPDGATEKAVSWAGAEHLFVVRQPQNSAVIELWCVPLIAGQTPQRLLTNVRLPGTGPYGGWRWQDVIATQVLTP